LFFVQVYIDELLLNLVEDLYANALGSCL